MNEETRAPITSSELTAWDQAAVISLTDTKRLIAEVRRLRERVAVDETLRHRIKELCDE